MRWSAASTSGSGAPVRRAGRVLVPLLAWNLSSSPSRDLVLTVAGQAVSASASIGNSYGIELPDLSVEEAGPGQVSSLETRILDPAGELTLALGSWMRLEDRLSNGVLFAGWLESFHSEPFGVGRSIALTGIGIEALLDWVYVPAMTIPAGTEPAAALQSIASAGVGWNGTPVTWATNPATGLCSAATPVGPNTVGATFSAAVAIPAGSLRKAIARCMDAVLADVFQGDPRYIHRATIDFYGGLRVWVESGDANPAIVSITDYDPITLSTAGPFRPSSTSHGVSSSGMARGVFVSGSGAGTGFVGDGTGIPGPTAQVSDASSTTAARLLGIGRSYLASQGITAEGSTVWDTPVDQSVGNPSSNQLRAGGFLQLTEASAGIVGQLKAPITSIRKSFSANGEQQWRIAYGARLQRASVYLRALTSDSAV